MKFQIFWRKVCLNYEKHENPVQFLVNSLHEGYNVRNLTSAITIERLLEIKKLSIEKFMEKIKLSALEQNEFDFADKSPKLTFFGTSNQTNLRRKNTKAISDKRTTTCKFKVVD